MAYIEKLTVSVLFTIGFLRLTGRQEAKGSPDLGSELRRAHA